MKFVPFDIQYSLFDILRFSFINPWPLESLPAVPVAGFSSYASDSAGAPAFFAANARKMYDQP